MNAINTTYSIAKNLSAGIYLRITVWLKFLMICNKSFQ